MYGVTEKYAISRNLSGMIFREFVLFYVSEIESMMCIGLEH